jgi:hypothetical protein
MKIQSHAMSAAAAMLILTAGQASAVSDAKSYAGVNCRSVGGGTFNLNFGDVYNSGSTPMSIMCPILQDQGHISSAVAKVFDRNPGEDYTCELSAETATGTFFTEDLSAASTGSGFWGPNVAQLTFSALTPQAYGYLACTVPSAATQGVSHFLSILVTET